MSQQRLTVRFNAGLAMTMLVLGVVNIFLFLLTRSFVTAFVGGASSLVGILWLVNPTIVKEGSCLMIKNAVGMTLKQYVYQSSDQLSVQGDVLYFDDGTGPVKVAKRNFGLNSSDWYRLTAAIQSEQDEARGG